MDASLDLLLNALVSGLLLGGFYAAVSIGVAISFGLLDVVNIAHPAFILLGSYVAFLGNTVLGIDPILAALIAMPAFYFLGMLAYQVYYVAFERRDDQSIRGLSFFFGPLGWLYAGSFRETIPAAVLYVMVAGIVSKILPAFLLMPVLMVLLPISAIGGIGSTVGSSTPRLAMGGPYGGPARPCPPARDLRPLGLNV